MIALIVEFSACAYILTQIERNPSICIGSLHTHVTILERNVIFDIGRGRWLNDPRVQI